MNEQALRLRPSWRVTAIIVALTMTVTACLPAHEEDPVTLTAAEKDLRKKTEDQRKADSALTGAAGGAIAGALIGGLLGGWRGALIGAATGGVAGAALGVGYASYMNARAKQYANEEARAAAVSQAADQTLGYYRQVNASASTILAEQERKIAGLNAAYKSRQISKEQFQQAFVSSSNNEANLREQLQGLENQLNSMRTDQQAALLTRQIQELETQRDALKATYDRLLELYGTVPGEIRVEA
jgi:uncharacterized protein YcfJ